MEIESKKCSKCGKIKPFSAFYKHKITSTGLRSDCKECVNISTKTWNKNNREKVRLSYNYFNTAAKYIENPPLLNRDIEYKPRKRSTIS
jgi:hypothetical protein